ncbi:hypothetical protein AWENTII_003114 [Aspergillus wentii]
MPSLAQRRRGFGPVKDRSCWTPRAIQPRMASDEPAIPINTLENQDFEYLPEVENVQQVLAADYVGQSVALDDVIQQHTEADISGRCYDGFDSTNQHMAIASIQSPCWSIIDTLIPKNDFISATDMQALSFHRAVFAPLKSTQDSSRSAHSLFLHRAFDRQMALHFLLAVSHSELAIHRGCGFYPPVESRLHFRRGFELFTTMKNSNTPMDHLNTMLSFLYMYIFWMRRDRLSPQRLHKLSRHVYSYAKKHSLEHVCSNEDLLFPLDHLLSGLIPMSDQVLLARILIYLYDRDGFCCFFGCGGYLANYINRSPVLRQAIWRVSRAPFLWPILDLNLADNSNTETNSGRVFDLYFELIVLHQQVNCLSQGLMADSCETGLKLRHCLKQIEQGNPFINDMKQNDQPQPLMACVTVTFFHALRIYLCRSTNHPFGSIPVHPDIQDSLSRLISAAYKTIATGAVQLLERFQWSLLIAGIETSDPVHLDWIKANISDASIRAVLHLILDEKTRLGGSISMQTIRGLVQRNCLG